MELLSFAVHLNDQMPEVSLITRPAFRRRP
jgi:hypothetical protein